MKKLLIRIAIVLLIVLVLAVVAAGLFMDKAIKAGIETVGPAITQVEIKLDAVALSLLSGSGKIQGLVVGNPTGFKSPTAIRVGKASLALQPGSLFSDKIVIRSVAMEGPEITFETDLRSNNLSKLLANVEAATGSQNKAPATQPSTPSSSPAPAKSSKKLEVDDFLIRDAKVNVMVTTLGKSLTLTLPEIHLTGLGTGPEGITPAELTRQVIQAIEKVSAQASTAAVSDLGKQASDLTKEISKNPAGAAEKLNKSLGGLLKKP